MPGTCCVLSTPRRHRPGPASPQPRAGGRRVQLPCGLRSTLVCAQRQTMQRASCSRPRGKETSFTTAQIGGLFWGCLHIGLAMSPVEATRRVAVRQGADAGADMRDFDDDDDDSPAYYAESTAAVDGGDSDVRRRRNGVGGRGLGLGVGLGSRVRCRRLRCSGARPLGY